MERKSMDQKIREFFVEAGELPEDFKINENDIYNSLLALSIDFFVEEISSKLAEEYDEEYEFSNYVFDCGFDLNLTFFKLSKIFDSEIEMDDYEDEESIISAFLFDIYSDFKKKIEFMIEKYDDYYSFIYLHGLSDYQLENYIREFEEYKNDDLEEGSETYHFNEENYEEREELGEFIKDRFAEEEIRSAIFSNYLN